MDFGSVFGNAMIEDLAVAPTNWVYFYIGIRVHAAQVERIYGHAKPFLRVLYPPLNLHWLQIISHKYTEYVYLCTTHPTVAYFVTFYIGVSVRVGFSTPS